MRSDVQEVFKLTPHDKQVMMFSATLDKEVRPICKKFMTDVSTSTRKMEGEKASFFSPAGFLAGGGDFGGWFFIQWGPAPIDHRRGTSSSEGGGRDVKMGTLLPPPPRRRRRRRRGGMKKGDVNVSKEMR